MKNVTPSSPLLTLVVEPKGQSTTRDGLAKFHPIMKGLGYGNFQQQEDGFYQASKGGDGMFGSELYVFAETDGNSVIINMDGHSLFGLKGVEEQLRNIQKQYAKSMDCKAEVIGPNYMSAFIGNIIYTALPIYTSAAIIVGFMMAMGGFQRSTFWNLFLYATLGVIGAKTRFWVNQRRKQRPLWLSIFILTFAAPLVLIAVAMVFWAARSFG